MSKKSSPKRGAGMRLVVPTLGAGVAGGGGAVWAGEPAVAIAIGVATVVATAAVQLLLPAMHDLPRLMKVTTACRIVKRAHRNGGDPIALIGALADVDNERR